MQQQPKHTALPHFADELAAWEWLSNLVDDPCVDNYRLAYVDRPGDEMVYDWARDGGCCGSADREVVIAGQVAWIGCNFGH